MAFDYDDESDYGAPGRPAGYPIPVEAKTQTKWIEGGYAGNSGVGGDKHMLIVDRDNRFLFETWNTRCLPAGLAVLHAGGPAQGRSSSSTRTSAGPETWTSADAAGLAILPGLVRYDEAFGTRPDPARVPRDDEGHERLRLARLARGRRHRGRPADGDAPPAEGVEGHLRLPGVRPADLPGDEDLRSHRGRQRERHVRPGGLRHPLGQRGPQPRVRRASRPPTSR